MKNRKGFTLVESMVVMIIMILIMSAVYMMILYYRDVAGTEQARVRQTQESRFLLSVFSSELKNAGAVMTLVNTGGFLAVPPHFNGIYPLNNDDFADGVIVASGDPNAVSKLISEADMTSPTSLIVNNTTADPAWAPGDKGILIGPSGYFVFVVTGVGSNSLNIRSQSVYHSGLLDTTNYKDDSTAGNTLTYPVNSPVMRLGDFSIYLVLERDDAAKGRWVRDLVRVSDCYGKGAVLTDSDPNIIKGAIAENVWDLQLTYTAYPGFPDVSAREDYYTYGGSSDLDALLNALRVKTLKEMTVNVIALTDDYPGRGQVTHQLPQLADRAPEALPAGKYNYRTYSFLVQPRNYNVKM